MTTEVFVIGHSYIRRLRDYSCTSAEMYNLKLDPDYFKVNFLARGGLTFTRLSRCPEFMNFTKPPQVCFVQMGENDLCQTKPRKVCTDIISYAQYLRDGVGVRTVIIGQLLRRQPWASSPSYNADVIDANNLLRTEIKKLEGIHFWSHRGFWADLSYLGKDGVHIDANSTHMKKYLHSIRIAVLQHSR
ncbi:uncharacterized protein LOC134254083 [Saccostrea cucullata]|uniref:uncharacterized protein LOC134254083 n=1 Tax=Saccostrea cuccullata TaxID=36930 RepID=UPI002ED2CE03